MDFAESRWNTGAVLSIRPRPLLLAKNRGRRAREKLTKKPPGKMRAAENLANLRRELRGVGDRAAPATPGDRIVTPWVKLAG